MLRASDSRSEKQGTAARPSSAGGRPRGNARILMAGGLGIGLLFAACIALLSTELGAEIRRAAFDQKPAGDDDQAAVRKAVAAASARTEDLPPPAPLDQQPAVKDLPPLPGRPATGVVPRAQPHRMPRGTPAPMEFFQGMRELQAQVDRCAQEGRAGGFTSPPGSRATFLVDFETLDRRVRVVDATLQGTGNAPAPVVACAQGVLLGHEIPVRVSQPGTHFKMPIYVNL